MIISIDEKSKALYKTQHSFTMNSLIQPDKERTFLNQTECLQKPCRRHHT